MMLLEDDEWNKWSDYKIADTCNVDRSTVWRIRDEMCKKSLVKNTSEKIYTDKHGTVTTMSTTNIGKSNIPALPVKKDNFYHDYTPIDDIYF